MESILPLARSESRRNEHIDAGKHTFERLPNWRRFLIAEVVMMAERIEGPAFMTFTCQCGGRIQALMNVYILNV